MSVMSSAIKYGNKLLKFAKAHKSSVCICGGLILTTGAVVEGCRATVKSVREIDEINAERLADGEERLTKKEVVKESIHNYFPTIGMTVAGGALIIYGHKVSLKQLSMATAGAKLLEAEYNELKESIEDVLSDDEEHKEIKGKIFDKFTARKHEKLYGDSKQAIDVYTGERYVDEVLHGVKLSDRRMYSDTTKVHRFKDRWGGEFYGTKDAAYNGVLEIRNMLLNGMEASLVDYYDAVGSSIHIPEIANKWIFSPVTINSINQLDIRTALHEDADGPYYRISWTEEPILDE